MAKRDVSAAARRGRRGRGGRGWSRGTFASGVMAIVSLIVLSSLLVWFLGSRAGAERAQERTVKQAEQAVEYMPDNTRNEEFRKAQEYNGELAEKGQDGLGVIVDPYAAIALQQRANGGVTVRADNRTDGADDRTDGEIIAADQHEQSAGDAEYQSLLDTGGGIMGTLSIPKIGATMPIYHGTSDEVLSAGAGHLYGTSMPVGGESSHAVLTAHRGLVTADLFTRLDEMEIGDTFSMEVMGNTLTYQVDRVDVVNPDDTSKLKITQGEDRVTLLTCTPYGVNTHRLLVSAVRVANGTVSSGSSDDSISPVRSKNALRVGIITFAVCVVFAGMFVTISRPDRILARHASDAAR